MDNAFESSTNELPFPAASLENDPIDEMEVGSNLDDNGGNASGEEPLLDVNPDDGSPAETSDDANPPTPKSAKRRKFEGTSKKLYGTSIPTPSTKT